MDVIPPLEYVLDRKDWKFVALYALALILYVLVFILIGLGIKYVFGYSF